MVESEIVINEWKSEKMIIFNIQGLNYKYPQVYLDQTYDDWRLYEIN